MWKKINDIDKMIQQWEDLPKADKQAIGLMAGLGAGLFFKGLVKMKHNKKKMDIINLVVPKDTELFIFVKGGK